MSVPLATVFGHGFFESGPVHTALTVGATAAIVSGTVGVFAVIRGQSFAGEALSDIGAAGGSAAFLAGVGALWGFLASAVGAAAVMELIGIQRPRGRDLATGIVLGASLGIAALLLYLGTTVRSTTGATVTILFGSLFAVDPGTIPAIVAFSALALAVIMLVQRPLLLSSLSPELAAARGIRVRVIGATYLLALAVAVALAALSIGAILGTALLIGPAATALRLTSRPGRAIAIAAAIGMAATWLGIVLAYDSFYWPPRGHGWPVSFFVVALVLMAYLVARLPAMVRRNH
ncbi:MAG: metal ABC transporter permease [Actinobacteria bacterium]|nr:MAG: metal ABC transporter permease [Actinomycetota bacterium]